MTAPTSAFPVALHTSDTPPRARSNGLFRAWASAATRNQIYTVDCVSESIRKTGNINRLQNEPRGIMGIEYSFPHTVSLLPNFREAALDDDFVSIFCCFRNLRSNWP